jgi:NAD(P)-dependent dehydrogenase (short-subunit alcohol dehydrogenase family)
LPGYGLTMTSSPVNEDPTSQHAHPDTEGEDQISHPGTTGQMDTEPDHGESSYQGTGRLAGKRALVTGGDSGIGRAVAIAFAREGADVAIAYLESEQDDGKDTVRLVEDAGRRALGVPSDLREEQQCHELIERTVHEFGGLDILVNNAAYQMAQPGGLEDITTEQFDRVLKTNLYAMFWLCKYALPHLEAGACIINTSSIQATHPSPELLDYALTKAGIVNFTKGLAGAVADRGIRVNTVAPGPIWTPLIPATMSDDKMESFGKSTPLGRAGQPAELAPAYVFFASPESSYVTGEALAVTGGMPF